MVSALLLAAVAFGQWSLGTPLPAARSEVAVASVNRRMYVIGGYANGNVDQRLNQFYDTATAVATSEA